MPQPLADPIEPFLRFLSQELKLGRKHLVLLLGQSLLPWSSALSQQVHTLCVQPQQPLSLPILPNVLQLPSQGKIALDEDTMDCALLLHHEHWSEPQLLQELRRVLRLNSYVFIAQTAWAEQFSPFTAAFVQWFSQFSQGALLPQAPSLQQLQEFFPNQYETKHFQHRWQGDWDSLWAWYQGLAQAIRPDDPRYELAKKSLHLLFTQHQTDGKIELTWMFWVHYGLFNKYIPAISLRKSIFFHALRPFAFLFYVLVKFNIYFWQLVYKLRARR
jgi:hypothetical protein